MKKHVRNIAYWLVLLGAVASASARSFLTPIDAGDSVKGIYGSIANVFLPVSDPAAFLFIGMGGVGCLLLFCQRKKTD